MSLGAVLPSMRGETDKLLVELAELARVKKETATERNQLAGQLADLADAQKRMAALVEERQKRQAEIEQAIGAERQRALALSRAGRQSQRFDRKARAGPGWNRALGTCLGAAR